MMKTWTISGLDPYWLWALLALPALTMIGPLQGDDTRALRGILHGSGEFAARFMIISMMATPLMMLFRGWRGPRWLVKNRRYFGVAAFGYAALHTAVYLLAEPFARVLAEATDFDILTGWLAFAIFLPLAATSMDLAVRKLGIWWKPLQRWVYAAAVLTLLHWAAVKHWNDFGVLAVHFGPLVGLTLYRLWRKYQRMRPGVAA